MVVQQVLIHVGHSADVRRRAERRFRPSPRIEQLGRDRTAWFGRGQELGANVLDAGFAALSGHRHSSRHAHPWHAGEGRADTWCRRAIWITQPTVIRAAPSTGTVSKRVSVTILRAALLR